MGRDIETREHDNFVIGIVAFAIGGTLATIGLAEYVSGETVKSAYDSDDAANYVEESGYNNPKLEDIDTIYISVRDCTLDDAVKYEFSATSSKGEKVGVFVCKGKFNTATIHQD